MEVGNYDDDLHKDAPVFYRADSIDGIYYPRVIINKACDFWHDKKYRNNVLGSGYFAGNSIKDFIEHELCHVLTYQGCATIKQVEILDKKLSEMYVKGITKYSDYCKDGAETIAEAFVSMKSGKAVPKEAELLVKEYIERWKK